MSYRMRRARWWMKGWEGLLFALCAAFMVTTHPIPLPWLTRRLAPLGGFLAVVLPGARRRGLGNLALIYPEKTEAERRAILRAAGRSFMALLVEYAHMHRFFRSVRLRADGLERLSAAREAGRGVVLVTAHYGNWEAIRLAAKGAGVEVGIIYRAFNNRYIDRYGQGLIAKIGAPVLHKGRYGVRRMLAHVERGGAVLILVDQRNTGAPLIPFLGREAETVTAAAELARRVGAALLPAIARRDPDCAGFAVTIGAEIEARDRLAAMTAVNDRLSAWIAAAPEQWFWFHRRWRRAGPR